MTCINIFSVRLDNFRLNFAAATRVCTAFNSTQQDYGVKSHEYPNEQTVVGHWLLSCGVIIVASNSDTLTQLTVSRANHLTKSLEPIPFPNSLSITLTMVCVCPCVCMCVCVCV